MSMKEIINRGDYQGPPKYLNQRDAPLEIPQDIVKAFFRACDQDVDDRITLEELHGYAEHHRLPLEPHIIDEMFHEITKQRAVIHEHKREGPLTLDEIQAAVRGRHRWNASTKEWEVAYRPCRDYWIIMLQTISERIFAMPVPKVVPTKIMAQYEQEEETMKRIREGTYSSLQKSPSIKKEGLEKKYLSVKEKHEPMYQRELDKPEAKVIPPGPSMSIKSKKEKVIEKNPYDSLINGRLEKTA